MDWTRNSDNKRKWEMSMQFPQRNLLGYSYLKYRTADRITELITDTQGVILKLMIMSKGMYFSSGSEQCMLEMRRLFLSKGHIIETVHIGLFHSSPGSEYGNSKFLWNLVSSYQTTPSHNEEDHSMNFHYCGNCRSHTQISGDNHARSHFRGQHMDGRTVTKMDPKKMLHFYVVG